MIRNQPHNTYKKRIVVLLRTIANSYGLMMKVGAEADITRSSEAGLTLHCKCKECGSHYTIARVPHDYVLLSDKNNIA